MLFTEFYYFELKNNNATVFFTKQCRIQQILFFSVPSRIAYFQSFLNQFLYRLLFWPPDGAPKRPKSRTFLHTSVTAAPAIQLTENVGCNCWCCCCRCTEKRQKSLTACGAMSRLKDWTVARKTASFSGGGGIFTLWYTLIH